MKPVLQQRSSRHRLITAVLGVIAAAIVLSACSTDSSLPAADELPDLEFGQGELPVTIPEGFPIPEGTTVGSTMIDGSRLRTEVVMIFPASRIDIVAFYESDLPDAGYEVTDTREDAMTTFIDFEGNGIDGTISVRTAGLSLSEGFLIAEYL